MSVLVAATESLPSTTDQYAWSWLWANGDVILGESRTDLVEAIVKDYPVGDDRGCLLRRYDTLCGLADMQQKMSVIESPDIPVGDLNEQQLTVLMADKRFGHHCPGEWPEAAMDLWLVGTNYRPYTNAEAPTGPGVHLLDPYDETTFLNGLVELGMGALGFNIDADEA